MVVVVELFVCVWGEGVEKKYKVFQIAECGRRRKKKQGKKTEKSKKDSY